MKTIKLILAGMLSVLAMSAVAVGTAQASQEWEIETDSLAELELAEETVSLTSSKAVVLSVPEFKMTLECTKVEGSATIFSGGTDKLTATLSSCSLVAMPSCKVSTPITISAKSEVVPTSSTFYEKVVPLTEGKPFATITVTGEACTLPEKSELSGTVAATTPIGEVAERPLTMSEAISKKANEEFKSGGGSEYSLTYGKKPATLTAEFKLKLSGANAGKIWQPAPTTVLCDTTPVNGRCPVGKNYAANTAVKASAESVLKIAFNSTATCNEFRLEGTMTSGAPLPGTFTTVVFNGCGACSVTPLGMPWHFHFFAMTNTIRLDEPTIEVTCAGQTCKYRSPGLESGAITGGGPAKYVMAKLSWIRLNVGGEGTCNLLAGFESTDAGGSLKAKFVAPTPMWVTMSS